jgi:hypothetical protein
MLVRIISILKYDKKIHLLSVVGLFNIIQMAKTTHFTHPIILNCKLSKHSKQDVASKQEYSVFSFPR